MNNDTNNNFNNGNVLGSTTPNPTQIPNQNPMNPNMGGETLGVETLGGVNPSMPNSNPVGNVGVNPEPNVLNNPNPNPQGMNNPGVESLNNGINNGMSTNSDTFVNQNNGVNPASVEPSPAFTNPQTIIPNSNPVPNNQPIQSAGFNNPNPAPSQPNTMPGFENPGTIGTTPPINLEPEKAPQKKKSKLPFIIIVLVVLAGVGFGTFYVLRYTNILNNVTSQITIETKDIEISLGDTLSANTSDYATVTGTAITNCDTNFLEVDVSKVGTYKYTVTCGEVHKDGTITVIDNTEVTVALKTVYKSKGENIEASEFAQDSESSSTYEFVDAASVNNIINGEAGSYEVDIEVTNSNGKKATAKGNLVIVENPIKGYLLCSSKDQNVSDIGASMTVSEKFAISDTDSATNVYGGLAFEIHTFTFSDSTKYMSYKQEYDGNSDLTINNVTGEATFDDTSNIITITSKLDNDSIKTQYGEENIATYRSLMDYFKNTLGYTCKLEK